MQCMEECYPNEHTIQCGCILTHYHRVTAVGFV